MLRFSPENIFNIVDDRHFDDLALKVFQFQYVNNAVYRQYVDELMIDASKVESPADIPFLPVSVFKSRDVVSGDFKPEAVFRSSGTTGADRSRHLVKDLTLYEASFCKSFDYFYGDPADIAIFALLPSYIERGDSSLIYMADRLIRLNNEGMGGFYLDDFEALIRDIAKARVMSKKVMLLGVSFALLELAEKYGPDLGGVIVAETGGMKGRRKEITREELHDVLCNSLKVGKIHSEYGMTELLSQAWSEGEGVFRTPPWMKVLTRDFLDPLEPAPCGKTGGINIIDLANIYSCSFLATQDLGMINSDGSFMVSGRFDNSDIRGCNLLIQ